MIQDILKEHRLTSLSIEAMGIGASGEAHLAKYKGKKYILRICEDGETAKRYEGYYKKFKKYGFFPKLLERDGKYVLFEFIKGRNCHEQESLRFIKQIGKICGIVNTSEVKVNYEKKFFRNLNSIKRNGYLPKSKIKEIIEFYKLNKHKVKLKTALDANDVTNDNFMVSGGKVYFVDIEAIKPYIKGFGIAKAFTSWFKTPRTRDTFRKGYDSASSMRFYTEDYADLCTLIFLVQRINFKSAKGEHKIVRVALKRLNNILEIKIKQVG